jgi:hypothetical protein
MTDILTSLSTLPESTSTSLLRRRYILRNQKKSRRLKPLNLSRYIKSIPSTRVIELINDYSSPTGLIPLPMRTLGVISGARGKYNLIKYVDKTRYENSLESRIYGMGDKERMPERLSRISAWTGKRLHPYIWRNVKKVETLRNRMLDQIIDHRFDF